jgi:hypothetical protein
MTAVENLNKALLILNELLADYKLMKNELKRVIKNRE